MRKKKQTKDKSRYYPPEMMRFALCSACLDVVLSKSEKARELYDRIIDCHDLPGCRDAWDILGEKIPARSKLMKQIVKESGYDYNKPPQTSNVGIPFMRGLLKGGIDLVNKYQKKYQPLVLKNKTRSRDFETLIGRINEFIKVGFNNEVEQARGRYKITVVSSELLVSTISLWSLGEYYGVDLGNFQKLKVPRGKKVHNLGDIVSGKIPDRMHRELATNYINAGFKLKHDQKLKGGAGLWYDCRVTYSGPEEYCRKMLINNEVELHPANVSNEIKPFDEAVGYPRGGKGSTQETPSSKGKKFFVIILAIFVCLFQKIKSIFTKS
ncbi:hypothetical protein ACFLU7_00500 [Chloroflexota bacterium]